MKKIINKTNSKASPLGRLEGLLLIFLSFAVFSCVTKNDPYDFDQSKYVYDIPDVPVTEDYIVGVQYNELNAGYWYDSKNNEPILYTGTPVLGEYDMKSDTAIANIDDRVLRKQLDYAKKAGIDFMIFGWNGYGSDTLFWNYDQVYRDGDPKIIVKFDLGHIKDKIKGANRLDDEPFLSLFTGETDSLLQNLMNKDYYFKNEGKPMMVVSNYLDANNVRSLSHIMNTFDERLGKAIYTIGEGPQWFSPERLMDTIPCFNAYYEEDMRTNNYDRFLYYYSFIDYQYNYWNKYMKNIGRDFIPVVMPGADNMANNPTSTYYIIEREKEVYRNLANVAKRNVSANRIIIINSWNNYRSGSGIEPTEEFGESYLEYTKEFFKK